MVDLSGTNLCDRCGDEYERYIVLIQDDFVSISNYVSSEYDDLCKPCRAHLHPRQAFTGTGEVTPKETVNHDNLP